MKAKIAVMASGGGSNLKAIIEYLRGLGKSASGNVVLVVSNREDAGALDIADEFDIPSRHVDPKDGNAILALFAHHDIDLVVLAGYLKLVPESVIQEFRDRIINIHPGPLPQFGGQGMYGLRVHEAVIAAGVKQTEITIHFVDEHYDRGAIITRWPVVISEDDSAESLSARVLEIEHIVFPRIIDALSAVYLSQRTSNSTF